MKRFPLSTVVIILSLIAIAGCNKKESNKLQQLDQQLQTATHSVQAAAFSEFRFVENKIQVSHAPPYIMNLFSQLIDIDGAAKGLINNIDTIRADIFKEAGNNAYEAGHSLVKKHILKTRKAKELWFQVQKLRTLTDSLATKVLFADDRPKLGIDSIRTEEEFIDNYFKDAPTGEALVALSSLQHDAAEINYFAARYVHMNWGETAISFSTIDVNIGITQSATQVKPNETIQITADVRDFTMRSEPQVFVNNKPAESKSGIAMAEIKPQGSGMQVVPVSIHFKTKDGKIDSIARTVVYKVMGSTP